MLVLLVKEIKMASIQFCVQKNANGLIVLNNAAQFFTMITEETSQNKQNS